LFHYVKNQTVKRLSAARLIQVEAVSHTLELAKQLYSEQAFARDTYNDQRRFEKRFPELAQELPHFIPGYDRSPAAARAILFFLEKNFAVSEAMVRVIRDLAGDEL